MAANFVSPKGGSVSSWSSKVMTGGSRVALEVVPEGEAWLNKSTHLAKELDNNVDGGWVKREDEGVGQSRGVTSPKRGPSSSKSSGHGKSSCQYKKKQFPNNPMQREQSTIYDYKKRHVSGYYRDWMYAYPGSIQCARLYRGPARAGTFGFRLTVPGRFLRGPFSSCKGWRASGSVRLTHLRGEKRKWEDMYKSNIYSI